MLNRCDQFSPFPGAPCAMSANVGDAHVKGAELELQLLPTDQLSIDAAVGYTDFEYTRIGPNVAVTRDMTTVYAPKTTATAGVQYRFELGGIGSITPRIDYAYRSKFYTEAVNADTNLIDGVGLANARLAWKSATSDWQASLAITNLFDKFYYVSSFDRAPAPNFTVWAQPGPPRQWTFAVKRSF